MDAPIICPIVNVSSYRSFNVGPSFPPLPEMNRIVAKVDQLMQHCDDLETGLAKAKTEKMTMATVRVLLTV